MTSAIAKQVKGATSNVKTHMEVFDRAREIYVAQMKRAEADYFDRIKRATKALASGDEPEVPEPHVEQPNAAQVAS
jgi:hypothetical protein